LTETTRDAGRVLKSFCHQGGDLNPLGEQKEEIYLREKESTVKKIGYDLHRSAAREVLGQTAIGVFE